MRISDWSSRRVLFRSLLDAGLEGGDGVGIWVCRRLFCFRPDAGRYTLGRCRAARWTIDLRFPALAHDANAIGELVFRTFADNICVDRKSVVSGKRGSVRVYLGGRRVIQKKKKRHR